MLKFYLKRTGHCIPPVIHHAIDGGISRGLINLLTGQHLSKRGSPLARITKNRLCESHAMGVVRDIDCLQGDCPCLGADCHRNSLLKMNVILIGWIAAYE
jgi:hypothetical protein